MSAQRCYQAIECVGCGYCCETATCSLGVFYGSRSSPCDFLIFEDRRYWCRLFLAGAEGSDQLYIGAGCCSSLNSKRQDYIKEIKDE